MAGRAAFRLCRPRLRVSSRLIGARICGRGAAAVILETESAVARVRPCGVTGATSCNDGGLDRTVVSSKMVAMTTDAPAVPNPLQPLDEGWQRGLAIVAHPDDL